MERVARLVGSAAVSAAGSLSGAKRRSRALRWGACGFRRVGSWRWGKGR